MTDIIKRAHVIKHSRGMCVVGAFNKKFHKVSLLTVPRAVLYFILHKSIFLHVAYHGRKFYDKYITSDE